MAKKFLKNLLFLGHGDGEADSVLASTLTVRVQIPMISTVFIK